MNMSRCLYTPGIVGIDLRQTILCPAPLAALGQRLAKGEVILRPMVHYEVGVVMRT